jgi:hypothetical protein
MQAETSPIACAAPAGLAHWPPAVTVGIGASAALPVELPRNLVMWGATTAWPPPVVIVVSGSSTA